MPEKFDFLNLKKLFWNQSSSQAVVEYTYTYNKYVIGAHHVKNTLQKSYRAF
jgi:hypothetical protein